MNLVRWDPFRELEEMSEKLNRMFSKKAPRHEGEEMLASVDWTPSVDISETEKEYLIKAELPEVKREDIKVMAEEGILTLRGERKQEKEETGKKFHRVERSYGYFERSFSLPDGVDGSKVMAEFKDGILSIHAPKTEKAMPKSIEVKAA